jgi:hypothetical protein
MKKRLSWGHESCHCVFCGNVGPRTMTSVGGRVGYAHKYCLPSVGIKKVRRPKLSTKKVNA